VTADALKVNNSWGDDDPSVFVMTIAGGMQGEFQVTNGYGPTKAPQVMKVTKYKVKGLTNSVLGCRVCCSLRNGSKQ